MKVDNSILSGIAYHNYAVLVAHSDCEQFFRNRQMGPAFSEPNDILTRECSRYYRNLTAYMEAFKPEDYKEPLPAYDSHLFNPACFVSLGNNGNVAIVAMDDFDLSTMLISTPDLPIRQTCLAFSPTLKSLGLAGKKQIFCELQDICDSPFNHSVEIEDVRAPRHKFLKNRPLLAISYYKLNGMAVLGPGLLMQQATYKAMARRIEETIVALNQSEETRGDIMSVEDVASFRCTFLDPQGWSDIVTVMFCRNYSVVATVLAQLRCLTHSDMYAEMSGVKGRTLEEYVRSFGLTEKVAAIYNQIAKDKWNEIPDADDLLRKNHLFCSSFTTLGMAHEAFEKNEAEEARSYYRHDSVIIADTSLVVCPGHLVKAKEAVSRQYSAPPISKPGYLWYTFGHNDCVYRQLVDMDYGSDKTVKLFDFVQQTKSMRDCSVPQKPIAKIESGSLLFTHVIQACSDLRIPVPQKLKRPLVAKGHVEIRSVLDYISKSLFQKNLEKGFNIDKLRESIKRLQLPTPLSGAVIDLYVDYSRCLSDAFLFDSVLDLYDIFTATYRLLSEELHRVMQSKVKYLWEARAFLSTEDLEDLAELVELMQSALSHRIQVAFREMERGGVTLDIRGIGINRLLNAADVPLKCGIGLLRKVMSDFYASTHSNGELNKDRTIIDDDNRRRIGGASKVSFDTRAQSHRLDIGNNPDYFLTSVDLNITHLTRPEGLLIHFHEAAHLICYLLRDKVGCTHPDYKCNRSKIFCHKCQDHDTINPIDAHIRERYEDIFSEMLVHRFVFEKDYKTYFRNFIAQFSLDPIAHSLDREEAFCRTFEALMRGFLITEPFRRPEVYSGKKGPDVTAEMVDNAFNEFLTAVDDVSAFLFDFGTVWGVGIERVERYFKKLYHEAYPALLCMWEDVSKIYTGICSGNEERGILGYDPHPHDIGELMGAVPKSIVGMIKRGLDEGRPLVRILYEDTRLGRASEEYGRLDAFFLIRHLLRLHIAELYGEVDTTRYSMCLVRGLDGLPKPGFVLKGKKWNRQLLDRDFNGLVAVDPDTRAKYMLSRIVIIKTFWDISTNLRARRMRDILKIVSLG